MYVDRLPPHDQRAEESVLGSLLIDGESIINTVRFLEPEDFYNENKSSIEQHILFDIRYNKFANFANCSR